MKTILFLIHILLFAGLVHGQAKSGIIVYNKTHQPAAIISLPYDADLISIVLDDQLKGSQRDDLKGFKIYRNTQLVHGDSKRADLYFKVMRNSISDTGASLVYMMVGMPNENIAKRSREGYFTKEHAKSFLINLVPVIDAYNLEVLIKQQNESIMQEELRFNDLVRNGEDLNKRKKLHEQKMLRNKHEQDLQNVEVERQKLALTYLISQRRP